MSFPNPHQFRTLIPGETARIYNLRVPGDSLGFITHIGNNSFDDSYLVIKVDGESIEENNIQREIGPIKNPFKYDPPFVVKNKIEVFATNNDVTSHIFEIVIGGYFMPLSFFTLAKEGE